MNYLPLQMKVWGTRNLIAFHSQYSQKKSFLPPFFFLALFLLLKQLCYYLLKGNDRFLLSSNHTKLFSLNLGLLFKSLGYFSGVPAMYAKASFSVEKLEAVILRWWGVPHSRQYPWLGHYSLSG